MSQNGHTHCWHTVGTVKRTVHGPWAPRNMIAESAMRCCHCGRLEASSRPGELKGGDIEFAEGSECE